MAEIRDVLMLKDETSIPLEEMCQKHLGKELKFFCTTCISALCSECTENEHKDESGHHIVKLGDVLEQVKRESHETKSESVCLEESPPMSSLHHTVNAGMSRLLNYILELDIVKSVKSRSTGVPTTPTVTSSKILSTGVPTPPTVTSSKILSTGVPTPPTVASSKILSTGVPTAPTVTSSTILTPEFQLESGRCRAGCGLGGDSRTMSNYRCPHLGGTGQSGPLAFGTCGSVDLAQPALHYWTIKFKVWEGGSGDRCEFGLASLQTLDTCGEGQRIFDDDVNSATFVVVRDGDTVRVIGRNWTEDVDTPQPCKRHDGRYTCLWEGEMRRTMPSNGGYRAYLNMTLGFLYDNRQPQSPRVLVVEAESCRLLGVRRLSPSLDLRPVFRVWPTGDRRNWADALLAVNTGPGILRDVTSKQLQSLLSRIDN